jgi:beta-galactosidase/beta-glucuronidase
MRKIIFNDNWTVKGNTGVYQKPTPVTLPHDAMLYEQRDSKAAGGAAVGYFRGGVYTYEKTYDFPEKSTLLFEGVYKNSEVLIDGEKAGGCAYGYTQFSVAVPSGEHKITVIARNDDQSNSRWYTGSGIYRPVWLCSGDSVNIKVTTVSYKAAIIKVEPHLPAQIYLGETLVAQGVGEIEIPNARLWLDETPNLYTCKISEDSETFGIRLVEWSPKGLFINGRETLLRGGCVHHDNGILGAASFAKSEERRVRKLKEAGYNAIRSAHNPCSVAMLEACDRLGMYVILDTNIAMLKKER